MCTYHFLKKKIVEWICGNSIAEIGGKKKVGCNWFVAMLLPKQREKFMAMSLLKMRGKKKIIVAEI